MSFHKFFTGALLLFFLFTVAGCGASKDKTQSVYNNYRFDTSVINKLPLYDSLTAAIWQKQPVLLQLVDSNEAYKAFRYLPASQEQGVVSQLPEEAGTSIGHYFTALGKNYIFAFDLFKDSTIKIYIRRLSSDTLLLDIEENLSFYPEGKKIRPREYPVKDTMLNPHCQYWIRFNEPGLFDLDRN